MTTNQPANGWSSPRVAPMGPVAALAALLVAALILAGCASGGRGGAEASSTQTTSPATSPATSPTGIPTVTKQPELAGTRPNIVMILMDDFSMDLLDTMAAGQRLAKRGATFDHFVVDSLCCVSRASLMTGQYPHQTGVLTNSAKPAPGRGPLGGWAAWRNYGNDARSVGLRLQKSGYTTGFVGKFLNEYEYNPGGVLPPVPAGWSQFNALFGSAYDGWGFDSTDIVGGQVKVRNHPIPSRAASPREKDKFYAGQVTEDYAIDFIAEHADDKKPWFLEVAPYAPHGRVNAEGSWPDEPIFPAAFADRPRPGNPQGNCGPVDCRSLGVEGLPGFGDNARDNRPQTKSGQPARAWNDRPALGPAAAVQFRRDRARMVQSVDRTLGRIMKTVDDDTVVILTSDNGFHLGQNGLRMGKGTVYDTDVRAPLIVAGPGITPGGRAEWTSNLDLAPTFEEWAGLRPARYRAGTSLLPALRDPDKAKRNYIFFDHTSDAVGGDPDLAFTGGELQRIPSYLAVRSRTGLLIRNDLDPRPARQNYGWEFYSYAKSTWEERNAYSRPEHAAEVADLTQRLTAFDRCRSITRGQQWSRECRDLTR